MSATKPVKNPDQKLRHSLSSIDKDALTAICSVCGPTDVHRATVKKKYTTYLCATKSRQSSRAYRLAHPHIPHPQQFGPTAHALSDVDDKNKAAVCSQCGPVKIYIRRSKNLITRVCKNASNRRSKKAEKNGDWPIGDLPKVISLLRAARIVAIVKTQPRYSSMLLVRTAERITSTN